MAVRAIVLVGFVAMLAACSDDDADTAGFDASLASDSSTPSLPSDAGGDALEPSPDAAAPDDGGQDAAVRSECVRMARNQARADSLCACEESDASTWPFVYDDAGVHVDSDWRVSLECMCALGYCRTLAEVVARSGPAVCGCGRIEVAIQGGLGLNPRRYTYDLTTLELVGLRAGGTDLIQGMCDESAFVAGEIGVFDCPDYRPCEVPESVVPCPADR
jgi:hypothetical protein